MKIRTLGAELFRSDGRLDGQKGMANLIAAFRNFVNSPKTLYALLFKIYVPRVQSVHLPCFDHFNITLRSINHQVPHLAIIFFFLLLQFRTLKCLP